MKTGFGAVLFSAVFWGLAQCLAHGRCSFLKHIFESSVCQTCDRRYSREQYGNIVESGIRGSGSRTSCSHFPVVGPQKNTGGLRHSWSHRLAPQPHSPSAIPSAPSKDPVISTVPLFFSGKCWAQLLLIPYGLCFHRFHKRHQLNKTHLNGTLNDPELGFVVVCFFLWFPLVHLPAIYLLGTKHVMRLVKMYHLFWTQVILP